MDVPLTNQRMEIHWNNVRFTGRNYFNWILAFEGVIMCGPFVGELILEKQSFDGFLMDELDPHLQHYNRRFLLTAGLITSVCVFLTTVSAMQRGYLTGIVEDCCADERAAHDHTLDRYSFMFERTTVAQLVEQHQRWQGMIDRLEN